MIRVLRKSVFRLTPFCRAKPKFSLKEFIAQTKAKMPADASMLEKFTVSDTLLASTANIATTATIMPQKIVRLRRTLRS